MKREAIFTVFSFFSPFHEFENALEVPAYQRVVRDFFENDVAGNVTLFLNGHPASYHIAAIVPSQIRSTIMTLTTIPRTENEYLSNSVLQSVRTFFAAIGFTHDIRIVTDSHCSPEGSVLAKDHLYLQLAEQIRSADLEGEK